MKSLMEALEQDPLNVRFYLPALTELSKRSSIEELDSLLPELQRSLREQALYQSSGYDESVRRYVKQLTTLFSAVLADSSGQTH